MMDHEERLKLIPFVVLTISWKPELIYASYIKKTRLFDRKEDHLID